MKIILDEILSLGMAGKADEIIRKAGQLEAKTTRCLLDPYYEAIAILRKKNWTFAQITEFLNDEGVSVTKNWVSHYWLRRHGPTNKSSRSSHPKKVNAKVEASPKSSKSAENSTSFSQNLAQSTEHIHSLSTAPQGEDKPNLSVSSPVTKSSEKKIFEFKEFDQSDWEELHQLRASKKT